MLHYSVTICRYESFAVDQTGAVLFERRELPEWSEKYYNMSKFAMQLNEVLRPPSCCCNCGGAICCAHLLRCNDSAQPALRAPCCDARPTGSSCRPRHAHCKYSQYTRPREHIVLYLTPSRPNRFVRCAVGCGAMGCAVLQ